MYICGSSPPPLEAWYFKVEKRDKRLLASCFSVAKLCATLCDPMVCSMPGSSVLHYLLEFAQIHIH